MDKSLAQEAVLIIHNRDTTRRGAPRMNENQDLLTTFPLATQFTTAEWITISIEDIDGNSQTFTREMKDTVGQATRLLDGASPEINPNPPITGVTRTVRDILYLPLIVGMP